MRINLQKYLLIVCALFFSAVSSSQTRRQDSLLNILRKQANDTNKTKTLVKLCWELSSSNIGKATSYGFQSLELSKKLAYPAGEANALLNIGICKLKSGNTDSALLLVNQAFNLFKKHGLTDAYYGCYVNLGNIYKRKSDYPRSLHYYLECLKIQEQKHDTSELADCYISLGLISSLQGKYNQAGKYYYKGLELATAAGNKETTAALKTNLGADYFNQDQLDSALACFNDALTIYEHTDRRSDVANLVTNIGMVYAMQNKLDKALEYVLRGRDELEQIGDKGALAVQYSSIAEIYFVKKEYGKSIEYFNKAIELQRELKDLARLKSSYFNLAELYNEMNNYKQAYHYLSLSNALKDSIYSVESSKQMAEMNARYETEKKDAQIQLLNKDKIIQDQKNSEEKRRQRGILVAVLAFLFFALILIFFIYKSNRRKQRDNEIIIVQKQEVEAAKEIIEKQKDLVEEKQKEILDSIHYAKRIQNALLAGETLLHENLRGNENFFLLFKPKDIVSGDFYWATTVGRSETGSHKEDTNRVSETTNSQLFYLAICDSTGHGVPGAFMSLLNIGFLSEAIKEKNILEPSEVFNYVRKRLIESISQEGQKDGFDGILVCFDRSQRKITYAAANNNPVIISNGQLTCLSADKMPVGKGEHENSFTLYTINYEPGDTLYLYTDGYADQFGGPKGKKFKYKQLDELLVSVNNLQPAEQRHAIEKAFTDWRGTLEQVDDICILGIRL